MFVVLFELLTNGPVIIRWDKCNPTIREAYAHCFAVFARVGNNTNRVQVRCAQWMMRSIFSWSDCRVSSVTGCDVTNCATTLHGFNKARLLASRGCVRFARRPSLHWEHSTKSTLAHLCRSFDSSNPSYQYPVTRIVTRRHCTTCQENSSRSALFPYQASISICGIVHVPAQSFRCRSDSHQSWLMTSLEVSEIPNLEWIRISCECVSSCDSLLVSLPLRVLCCCLLSRVLGMIVQSLFRIACAKIKSADSAPRAYSSDSPLDKATVPVLDTHSSGEIVQRNTESLGHRPSQHQNIPWRVSRSCSSRLVSMQVSSGRRFSSRVPFKYLNTFLSRVKSASVGDASLYDKHFVANIRSGLYCSFPTTALNNECLTWSFRQRRHHCLCVLQLDNVVGFTVNPRRSPSCTLRYSNPR